MKKVLIVDDAHFMRMLIRNAIAKSNNLEVVGEAGNVEDAIEKYKELKPDIVTMDITMPDRSGIEGVMDIIKIDPNAKIIMVSAMGQQIMVVDAIKAGAKDFIVKPFSNDKMIETINKFI